MATAADAHRQPPSRASTARTGRKISWPVAYAADRTPVTRPRRATNHRVATTAASGDDRQPVAAPMTTPQSSVSCQSALMPIVAAVPAAVAARAAATTRRTPNRSISAAEKGAIRPKSTRLIEIASETWLTRHPNSSSSGPIRIVGVARTPDAISSATNAAPATTHA